LYGDCLGSLERLRHAGAEAAAVVLEWSDLDPRLGLRQAGSWRPRDLPDILATVKEKAKRIAEDIDWAAATLPVALCLPTLPIPPVGFTPGWQDGHLVLQLRGEVSALAARLGSNPRIRLANCQRLDQASPPGKRLDVDAELRSGFPYRLAHADAVAELLSRLLSRPQ